MSHNKIEYKQSKSTNHSKTRSVIYYRSYQLHQTKPNTVIHFTLSPTTEHQSHNLPPCQHTTRTQHACANPSKNINKHSVVYYTSAHPHCAKEPQTLVTLTIPTPEHIPHAPPTQCTTLYRRICDCAELCTLTQTKIINIFRDKHLHYRSNLENFLPFLIPRMQRTCFLQFMTDRYNVGHEKLSCTGNPFYKKPPTTITKAGIWIYNGN